MLTLSDIRVDLGGFSLEIDRLHVRAGEYLVILGPNGAGKTVLLETIAGLHGLRSGKIELRRAGSWEDITAWPAERRDIGFVYQDYLLFPHLSVADNIGFGLRGRTSAAERRVRVKEAAELTGVEQFLKRRPSGLSGGEQQKVALARALVVRPAVLLLDEPLAALDRMSRNQMAAEMKSLCRDLGGTALHVTHSLDEAVSLGDEVAALGSGRLLQVASPGELLRRPVSKEVAYLVGCENLLPAVAHGQSLRLPGGQELQIAGSATGDVTAAIRAEDLVLANTPGEPGPGRWNVLPATVASVEPGPMHFTVGLACDCAGATDEVHMKAFVLPPEVSRMDLRTGVRVWASVEADRVHVCEK